MTHPSAIAVAAAFAATLLSCSTAAPRPEADRELYCGEVAAEADQEESKRYLKKFCDCGDLGRQWCATGNAQTALDDDYRALAPPTTDLERVDNIVRLLLVPAMNRHIDAWQTRPAPFDHGSLIAVSAEAFALEVGPLLDREIGLVYAWLDAAPNQGPPRSLRVVLEQLYDQAMVPAGNVETYRETCAALVERYESITAMWRVGAPAAPPRQTL